MTIKNNVGESSKNIIYHPCSVEEEDSKTALQTRLHTLRFIKDADCPGKHCRSCPVV